MSMNEMYHYTLQQEILNEQAANQIADLISLKISSQGNASVVDSLLRRLSLLKPTIISEDTLNDEKLAEIRGLLGLTGELILEQVARVAS